MSPDMLRAWRAATQACLIDGNYVAPTTPEQWERALSAAFDATPSALKVLQALVTLFSPLAKDCTQADWIERARTILAEESGSACQPVPISPPFPNGNAFPNQEAPNLLVCLKWMVRLYEDGQKAKGELCSGVEYCASLNAIAAVEKVQVGQGCSQQALIEALRILADFPIDEFGMATKTDSFGIFRSNDWQLTLGHVRAARRAIEDHEPDSAADASVADADAQAVLPEQPVAWIRYCSDGTYEGPIHDSTMDDIRRKSGAWTPLGRINQRNEAAEVCAQAYQVVGSLLDDIGMFNTPLARKILDNLSQQRMVHSDVLPWPPCVSSIAGVVDSIGNDEAGRPRILISTTRDQIKALGTNMLFRQVTVRLTDTKEVE